jgi:hypothetical protein
VEARPNLVQTVWGAFFLREDTYTGMRDDTQRIRRALTLIVVVGLLVGVTGAIGRLTEWAFAPPIDKVQETVLNHLMKMPWYAGVSGNPRALATFNQWYDLGWQIAKALAPSPWVLLGVITTPLTLLIVWFIYGLLAHLAARIMGGQGRVGQTLACTALAVAPQLLSLVMILPGAVMAGVGTWTLVCNFMAVRSAHGLTGWRALVATLLPLALAILVGAGFACAGIAVAGAALGRLGGAQ